MSTDAPTPTLPAASASVAVDPGSTATAPSAASIARARRILRVAAVVVGGLSVVMLVMTIVMPSLWTGLASFGGTGAGEEASWALVVASPALIVIALNLLVWRALLPGLGRRSSGEAVALVIVIALALAVASIIVMFLLLLLGFFAAVTIGF